jgi:serine protease Do
MKNITNYFSKRQATLAVVGALALAGSAVAFTQKPKAENDAKTPAVALDERPLERDGGSRASFAPVVKKIAPAVVRVFTTAKVHNTGFNGNGGDPAMNDMLRQFFGRQFQGQGHMQQPDLPTQRQQGVGSGVIATKDGYILTNNHVVDGAEEVKVALQDGREFKAKVIGRDPKSDVAVIKIDAKDLPAVTLADSDKVEVGDVVLAIGNPFGIGQTVTTGIVSAKGRSNMGLDYEDFIQTDAAINPGNSGGALVDADGRLIGINTAILSRSGGNQGIGFAIPSNMARDVMTDLIKDGKVERGYLGVMIQDVTPALAKEFNLKDNNGAIVSDVMPRSPADKAGLTSGDVITEFDGHKVSDGQHLKLAVGKAKLGETIPVKFLREGSTETVRVTIKDQPGTENLAKADSHGDKDKDDTGTLVGVGVGNLDRETRQELKLPENLRGAVVTEVKPDSAAAEAGLKPGDIIQEIDRKAVKNADDAIRLTEKKDDKATLLRIWREGNSHYMVVDENKAG